MGSGIVVVISCNEGRPLALSILKIIHFSVALSDMVLQCLQSIPQSIPQGFLNNIRPWKYASISCALLPGVCCAYIDNS